MSSTQAIVYGWLLALLLVPVTVGRLIRRFSGGKLAQALASLPIVASGVAFGVWAASGSAKGVSEGQALWAGVCAGGLLVVLPALAFLQLGYRVRSRVVLVVIWISALMPLGIYLFVVGVGVILSLGCPDTQNCELFS